MVKNKDKTKNIFSWSLPSSRIWLIHSWLFCLLSHQVAQRNGEWGLWSVPNNSSLPFIRSFSLSPSTRPLPWRPVPFPRLAPSWVYTVVCSLGKVSSNMGATVCFCMGYPWSAASCSHLLLHEVLHRLQWKYLLQCFLLHGKSLFQAQEHLLPLLLLQPWGLQNCFPYTFSHCSLSQQLHSTSYPFFSIFPQGAHTWLLGPAELCTGALKASCILHAAAPPTLHRGAVQAPLSAPCHGNPIHHPNILHWNQYSYYTKIVKLEE